MIVGKTISRRAAIILHSILNVVAVGIAYYLAREAHHAEIVFLFLIISLVLWFYSSRIKKTFYLGKYRCGYFGRINPADRDYIRNPVIE